MTEQTTPNANEKLAAEQAASLRDLAAFVEANPVLAPHFESAFAGGLNLHARGDLPVAEQQARFARLAARYGAKVDKRASDKMHNVDATISGIRLSFLAWREEVCELVQVGEEVVTKTVPDPAVEVPLVEITETVPKYKWQCKPLLAGGE